MEKLELLEAEYNKFIEWGYKKSNAINEAIKVVFKGQISEPYVYKDNYEEPSHVFQGDYVFLIGDGIYKKVSK